MVAIRGLCPYCLASVWHFSVSSASIPLVMVRELSIVDCQHLVDEVGGLRETKDIEIRLYRFLKERFETGRLAPL